MFYGAPVQGSYLPGGNPIAQFAANYDAGVPLNQSPYAPLQQTTAAPRKTGTTSETAIPLGYETPVPPPVQAAKKSRKGIGGRPRKHPVPEAKVEPVETVMSAPPPPQSKQRRARRTATNNKLSAMVVEDSDDEVDPGATEGESTEGVDASQGTRRSGRAHKPTAAALEAGIESLSRPTSSSSHASAITGASAAAVPTMAPLAAARRGRKGASVPEPAETLDAADEPVERPAKRVRRPTARAQGIPQYDGGYDSANDADINTFTSSTAKSRKHAPGPPLSRKVSVYEEYQALSSPTHNPLAKRGKRSAALKARRSFNVNDTSPEEDDLDEDVTEDMIIIAEPEPSIKHEQEQHRNGSEQRMSEYERFQALTSPSGGEVLGKRKRKPVIDMRQIMALEQGSD